VREYKYLIIVPRAHRKILRAPATGDKRAQKLRSRVSGPLGLLSSVGGATMRNNSEN
jgi:hypothetical protein